MTWLLTLFCASSFAGPIKVHIHKDAATWEPIEILAGGDPAAARCVVSWKLHQAPKGKKGYLGPASKCRALARSYPIKDDTLLIVSVFPAAFAAQRVHFELRFLLVEGYLEEFTAAAVTAGPGGGADDDAHALKSKGISYQEEIPVAGKLRIAAIDGRPSKGALNAGSLRLVEFSRPGLGFVNVDYSARGVAEGGGQGLTSP